jgi:hypothetical protein
VSWSNRIHLSIFAPLAALFKEGCSSARMKQPLLFDEPFSKSERIVADSLYFTSSNEIYSVYQMIANTKQS